MLRRLPTRVAVFLLTVLLMAAAAKVFAQSPQSPQRREHKHLEHEQIVALEREWRQAVLADDAATMDKLLSEDYLGITATGEVHTKAQELDHMRDHKLVITKLENSDFKIKLIGRIAIVTSLAQVEGSSDDTPLHGAYRYTRVYQRVANGIWKVTNFEVTPANRLHGQPSTVATQE
jgi:ketosteroid isomerase-like protein